MKHDLREYQTEMEEAVFEYLFTKSGNPVVAAPGGVGKSHVMNRIIKRAVTGWSGTRVLSLVHDQKIIDQNCNSMLKYWPLAPVGIYSAGLKRRDTYDTIIYAGIQSVAKRARELGKFHLVIIDECDLVSSKEETLYQKLINDLKQMNPMLRVIGFTATPYRLGTGCLTNIDMWDEICIDMTKTDRFNEFIRAGYLSPLVTKRTIAEIDITDIAMKGGDFDEKQMQEAADKDELNKAVVEECVRYGADRKHWLVFSSGVKHGHKLAKLFNARGVSAVMLTGDDTVAYREEMEDKFRSGEFRCLVNCGLYGRGWDFPALDLLAWARATQSVALWVQGCVRGTRRASGKTNCLILDFAGNIRRLGPVNDPVVPAPRRKGDAEKGEAPVKECPQCHSYLHTRTMECPDCGYVFPPPQTIQKTASSDQILASSAPVIDDFRVLSVRYKPTISKNNNYYLKVTYGVGTAMFNEFLFFDSGNHLVQRRNKAWWLHRGGNLPIPVGTDEAAERAEKELFTPSIIRVDISKKYPDVLGCDFDPDARLKEEKTNTEVYDDDDNCPF